MKIKNMLFVVIVFAGLFISITACQPDVNEDVAEIVVVEKTAVYTPTSEPTATPTTEPTATLTPTTDPTVTPSPTPTIEPIVTPLPTPTVIQEDIDWMPEVVAQDTITYFSKSLAEYTGVSIAFQYPRRWQTGFFSDSGTSGWLVSNVDPTDAFWYASNTGEEIIILIIPSDLDHLVEFSEEAELVELDLDDGIARYSIDDDEFGGYIIKNESVFLIFGSFSLNKGVEFREGVELIFGSFSVEDIGDEDLSDVWLIGHRLEGLIEQGETAVGYVPFAAASEWTFIGTENQEISLSITTYKPNTTLVAVIIDENNHLVLLDDPTSFTDSITFDSLTIPEDGTYAIIVAASTDFYKTGPWDSPSEENSYGWYDISIAEATESTTNTPLQPTPTATPSRTDETLNPDWLITADDLNSFFNETSIVEWEVEGDDLLWNTRVCRNHLGWSWSSNQNLSINCILSVTPGATFESVVDGLYEQDIIRAEAVSLEPYHQYEDDIIIVSDRLDNGHTFYDMFLMRDNLLYWNSISVGTPPGYTSEMIFEEGGEGIETFLYDLTLINIGRSNQ